MRYHVTADELRKLMSYDSGTGIFHWLVFRSPTARAGSVVGSVDKDGYLETKIHGSHYKLHRLAWLYVYGEDPEHDIDHRDNIRSNNRIKNLRNATKSQNLFNQGAQKNNSCGAKGVSRSDSKSNYRSRITINGRELNLGSFKTIESASAAYKKAAERDHGEFIHPSVKPQ